MVKRATTYKPQTRYNLGATPIRISHEEPSMTPRIAVVGAGIAGLNAAHRLQDAGLACEIYEAADRVGGRMHSDTTTWADSLESEWCGEFIDADHTAMHELIARFGLETRALDRGGPGRSGTLLYFGGHPYRMSDLAAVFEALAPVLNQQYQAAGFPTTHDHFTQEGERLDHLSAYDWIEQYVPGGHGGPIGRYLDSSCRGINGLETSEQSALNLVYQFGSWQEPGRSGTAGPLQGTTEIIGGNALLPQAIASGLLEGSIHLGHRLAALERTGDRVNLTFATASGSMETQCDNVILTLPFSALRSVNYQRAGFDALKQTAIEQLGYGAISKLILEFDQRYWYKHGLWPGPHGGFLVTDLDMQTVWDASIGQTGSHGLLLNYTSGRRGAAYAPPAPYTTSNDFPGIQGYAHDCLEQLERVFPGISAHYTGRATLSYATGDPYLLGSYSCWRVGQYTQFAGYEGARQGPIHFAGEHCSLEFQGYMEGAARQGMRAAQEILEDVG
jgi:monoamine oxidase